jgi:protein-S-isoprenylcysteine O-methyltransferase Ste14
MEAISAQMLPAALHIKFLIFDWSVPNLIMGAVIVLAFFAAIWARLPKWIEHGRDTEAEK